MRLRFALAAALPALASLAAMALLGDRLARRALEAELGARLVAVAQAAAAGLPADRVASLAPGDEETRTYGHVRARVEALARATGTRLVVARLDRTSILDSQGVHRIGDLLPALERDRFELLQVAAGSALASQVLFQGKDGELYKTGYAPLADEAGQVIALVAADGTAPSFVTLRHFRSLLVALAILGALLGGTVSVLAALSVTRPLRQLAAAARRIGEGDLETALARRWRAEDARGGSELRTRIDHSPSAWRRFAGALAARCARCGRLGSAFLGRYAPCALRRWRAEDARGGSGDEVETLRATLEEMRKALRRRDRDRETMLAGIAHEVRNPLGAIELFAGALADDVRGRPEAAHVARIRSELAGLARLVEDFLDYARARPLSLEEVDAALLAAEVRELALPLARERGVELTARGSGRLVADRHALRRAALNLVRNAIEASEPGSGVELAVQVREGEASLTVLDRGRGLCDEAREHLFEPFFTTKERGTGLGLALARKAAEAHGGRLLIRPREGGGTAATLALPAGMSEHLHSKPVEKYSAPKRSGGASRGRGPDGSASGEGAA